MKFLVTGADGQLGSSLKKISADHPQHEFVFTDLPQADITDREAMGGLVGKSGAEVIVNCAAYTAVDKAESDEAVAEKINAYGPGVLAGIAKQAGAKLIHISTDYVFDGNASRPIKETDPVNPINAYGRTKLRGEEAVMESGCDAAIIRTSWLYSEYGSNFVKTMLRLGGEKRSLSVVDDQYGTPTYAGGLAGAIIKVAESGIDGCEIYHYSDAGKISWCEFAREIFRRAGMDVDVSPVTTADYPTAARRPAYSVLSKDKIAGVGVVIPDWKDSLAVCLAAMGVLKK